MLFMECGATIVLVLAFSFICLRSRRKDFAIAIIPLIILPAIHIGGIYLSRLLSSFLPFSSFEVHIFMDIMALLVACILFGLNSGRFTQTPVRRGYLWICGGFTLLFAWILVSRILHLAVGA